MGQFRPSRRTILILLIAAAALVLLLQGSRGPAEAAGGEVLRAESVCDAQELKALQLGEGRFEELSKKIAAGAAGFANVASRQRVISGDSRWIQFGGGQPGIVPAGVGGSLLMAPSPHLGAPIVPALESNEREDVRFAPPSIGSCRTRENRHLGDESQ